MSAPDPVAQLTNLWEQDVEIDSRVRSVVQALDAGNLGEARAQIGTLRDFIHRHLEREEEIYFPAAEKLSPENAYALRVIRVAHLGIREDLAQLDDSARKGHVDAARTQISAFLESFRAHEQAEDRVLEALGASRPG